MSEQAHVAPAHTLRRFLHLHGEYCINPSAKNSALADDASWLLESVIASVSILHTSLSGGEGKCSLDDVVACLGGIGHQLQMIQNLVNAVEVSA
jgi:hypothetical protein